MKQESILKYNGFYYLCLVGLVSAPMSLDGHDLLVGLVEADAHHAEGARAKLPADGVAGEGRVQHTIFLPRLHTDCFA